MDNQTEQSNIKFITCPVCEGTGKGRHGLGCSNCSGAGIGAFYRGRFFYYGFRLSKTIIKLSRLKRSFDLFFNLIVLLGCLAGFVSLGFWIWQADASQGGGIFFDFWREKNPLILIFWLSVIIDMFIIYRISEDDVFKQTVYSFKKENKHDKVDLPDNWEELKKIKSKLKIDVSSGFSSNALQIIEQAFILANNSRHSQVRIMHLFFASLRDHEVSAVFSRLNIDGVKLISKVKNQLLELSNPTTGSLLVNNKWKGGTIVSNDVKKVFIEAYIGALEAEQHKVKPINFLLPAMEHNLVLNEILYELEIDKNKINNVIAWFRINDKLVENYKIYKKTARYKPASTMDKAYTAVATPALNHFAYDKTIAAKWGRLPLCVSRDKEIEEIFQALESNQSGVMLVGPAGVGKNTIIGGIARLMVEEKVPKILKDKRLIELDISRLVSGADPSQAEQRLLVIIDEVVRAGNIVLYIDNIENIIGITAGAEQSLDLSEVLAGALERSGFYCLASATSQNYAKYIEGTPLGDALAKITIDEPSGDQAIQIIESKVGAFEQKYKVYFSYNSIAESVELAGRYIHDKYLPDKAIDILESAAIKIAKEKGEQALIGSEDVAGVVSEITRIPVTKVTESEGLELLNLEDKIHECMINQEEAVKMVSASLRRARAELREGKRPIANFLFLGPTGVGKTELAKTVAKVYFGNEDYMVRIDMSEYQHPDSVKKMIGTSSGVKGYLTEAVRQAPFSLVLLDEIEKANPDILNLFLQVMDDGRLTDGQGRTIDFTNSIIIATSNAGAVYIQEQIIAGAGIESIKQALINEHLNKYIRPELINRFDGVIVFKPLSMQNVVDITKLMLNQIGRLLEEKGMGLRFENEGVAKLAEQGFDPKFGARPLRRLLQEKIEDIIANKILAGELKRRDVVVIDSNADVRVEKGREL
ncbi:ATP-dependent Clp protease ATP-binding subunit [Patescibacteria group bacterium]|nr:ATP-dependent Clp protease ATP-binding subunit [Patescibacteria group bacterium]